MYAMGYTLNQITMLSLTLMVGIVVDDAIVVLENIYRFIEEKGMSPYRAAIEGTREIGLAVLGDDAFFDGGFCSDRFYGRNRRTIYVFVRSDFGVCDRSFADRFIYFNADACGALIKWKPPEEVRNPRKCRRIGRFQNALNLNATKADGFSRRMNSKIGT